MSKKVSRSILELLKEADELAAAPAPAQKAVEPGQEANGETEADLDADVKALDKDQDLLPEAENQDNQYDGDEKDSPNAVVPVAQKTADDSKSAVGDDAEMSLSELAADVDPDIADLIKMMAEAEESEESPFAKKEDKKDEDKSDDSDEEDKDEDKSDASDKEDKKEDKDEDKSDDSDKEEAEGDAPEFSKVDNVTLGDDEVKDIADKASEDEDGEKKQADESADLPGSEDLSKENKFAIKRLFDESVAAKAKASLPAAIKLAEAKLNSKFQALIAERDAQLNEQFNHYGKYAVECWIKENTPAIHSAAQVKAAGKIFESVRNLVEMFDIKTIDKTLAIVKMYESKVAKLATEQNKLVSENANLVKEVSLRDRALVISEAVKGLPLTEQDRFKTAASQIKAADLKTFKENVAAIRNSLTAKPQKVEASRTTNESLVLQGGVKGVKETGKVVTPGDFLGKLISESQSKQ